MEASNKAVAIAVVPVEEGKDYDLLVLTEQGEIWVNRDFQIWGSGYPERFPDERNLYGFEFGKTVHYGN